MILPRFRSQARGGLFLSVLFNVRSARLFGVVSGMDRVAPCGVCMVRGLFVLSALVVLSRFPMVASGLRVVLCGVLMVFGWGRRRKHGHGAPSRWRRERCSP
jgi:hypothetical protein